MNTYQTTVRLPCLKNNLPIDYWVEIQSVETIMVEDINAFLLNDDGKGVIHEVLADDMYDRFGGWQTIKAMHHGVHITTTRGSL